MNRKKIILLITRLLFATLAADAAARPLFQQDFPSNTLAYYINSTDPTRGQFTNISAKPSGGLWSLVDTDNDPAQAEYALQLVRTAGTGSTNGAGITRRINLDATAPGMICLRFDLSVVSQSERTSALAIEVGNLANTPANYNSEIPAADIFGKLHLDLKGDGTFKLKLGNNISSTNYTYAADTTKCPSNGTVATISYYLNNSGTTRWYRAPDGSCTYLSTGKCLVWIEWDDATVSPAVHRVHLAVGACPPLIGENSNLNNFRLRWTAADSATWRIDNVRVENVLVPSMYGFPAERLVEAKARIAAADTAIMPAYDGLISQANAIDSEAEFPLRNTLGSPPRLTFGTPPDDRLYYSIGIYWWPDPANPSAPWHREDGHPNYANENASDSGDFRDVCEAVGTLSWAYYLMPATAANQASRTTYARRAAALVREWFLDASHGMRPSLQYAGTIPNDPVNAQGSSAGLIDSGRLIELCDNLALLADSTEWTTADQLAWKTWITTYRDWLLAAGGRGDTLMDTPLNGSGNNNHTTWFDAQIAQYSLISGDYRIARKKIEDAHTLYRLPYQSTANGSQPRELARSASLDYSAYNATAMLTLAQQGLYFNYNWTLQVPAPGATVTSRSLRKIIDYFAPYVSASPDISAPLANWTLADPDANNNQGDRQQARRALALGASVWQGDSTYPAYWSLLAPLLLPGACYDSTSAGVTTRYYYATERWNLFLPPAP